MKQIKNLAGKTAGSFAIAAVVYCVLFFFVDRPVVLWVHEHWGNAWPHDLGKSFSFLVTGSFIRLGIGLGFILVIAVDSGLNKRWSRMLLYLCVSGAVAIALGDGLKFLLGRHRPVMLFDQNLYGLTFFTKGWEQNSTPSGHTIRAFSLLTGLSLLYRRFAAGFLTVAALIGISRVLVTDHYPSDVLFGAFIGIFTALWAYTYFSFQEHGKTVLTNGS